MDPLLWVSRRQGRAALLDLPDPVVPSGLPHGLVGDGSSRPDERCSVVVVGDEFAAGQGSGVQVLGPVVAEAVRSRSGRDVVWQLTTEPGAMIEDVHLSLSSRVPRSVDVVVLVVGAHDVLARTAVSEWRRRLESSLQLWQRVPQVVVCGVPPLGSTPVVRWPLSRSLSQQGSRLDEASRAACSGLGRPFVELDDAGLGEAGFAADGWSPSEALQRVWAGRVTEALSS